MSRVLAAVLVLALLAGCGGDEEPETTTTSVATTEPTTTLPEAMTTAPAATTTAPASTTTTRRQATTAAPPASSSAAGPAKAGEYLFDTKGAIKTLGCLTSNQALPDTTKVRVGAPNGNRQQVDRDQSGNGVQALTNVTFEYRPDGVYIAALKQSQTVANQSVVFDFEANPPVLAIPANPVAGQAGGFKLTSRDGMVNIEASTNVQALNEQVTLGNGAATKAHKILTVSNITGASPQGTLNVQISRTSWYSPELHLEVKESTDTTGTVGLCRVDFHIESVARSV